MNIFNIFNTKKENKENKEIFIFSKIENSEGLIGIVGNNSNEIIPQEYKKITYFGNKTFEAENDSFIDYYQYSEHSEKIRIYGRIIKN